MQRLFPIIQTEKESLIESSREACERLGRKPRSVSSHLHYLLFSLICFLEMSFPALFTKSRHVLKTFSNVLLSSFEIFLKKNNPYVLTKSFFSLFSPCSSPFVYSPCRYSSFSLCFSMLPILLFALFMFIDSLLCFFCLCLFLFFEKN